jgi:methylated-DNA-[protein]-cysteine S-methyltransferase
MMSNEFKQTLDTPIGLLEVTANDNGLTKVAFVDAGEQGFQVNKHTLDAVQQLTEYFEGKRSQFSLALAAEGTDFQKCVWQALLTVPYGKTTSYGEIARQIDKPKAVRAVGAANGRNPLAIVVPCHRIIGSSGKLVGYASGLPRKTFLLNLERADL